MAINTSYATYLFPSASSSLSAFGITNGTTTASQDPLVGYKIALKNKDKQVEAKAKEPMIRREVEYFKAKVANATSPDELLNDYRARAVLLKANGLGSYVNYAGLAKKALNSDLTDPASAANRLASTVPAWLETAKTYDFKASGLTKLKDVDVLNAVADAYAEAAWNESTQQTSPGVAEAMAFKDRAASLDNVYKILGDPIGREVVLTAFQIPKEIAYQSVETQGRVIERKLDVTKLKNEAFVEKIVQRYLIEVGTQIRAGTYA